jgi:hypothetical protein
MAVDGDNLPLALGLSLCTLNVVYFCCPRTTLRNWTFTFTVIAITVTLYTLPKKRYSPSTNSMIGLFTELYTFRTIAYCVMVDPEKEYRRKEDPLGFDITKESLFEKWRWGWSRVINLRGVGWNWAVRDLPTTDEPEYRSKTAFILKSVKRTTLMSFIQGICLAYLANFSTFYKFRGTYPGFQSLADEPTITRIFSVLSLRTLTYVHVSICYYSLACLMVIFQVSNPKVGTPIMVLSRPLLTS